MALFCADYFVIRSAARHWLVVGDDADYLVRLVFQGHNGSGTAGTSFVPAVRKPLALRRRRILTPITGVHDESGGS